MIINICWLFYSVCSRLIYMAWVYWSVKMLSVIAVQCSLTDREVWQIFRTLGYSNASSVPNGTELRWFAKYLSDALWPYDLTPIATALTAIVTHLFLGNRSVLVYKLHLPADKLPSKDIPFNTEQASLWFHMYLRHGCFRYRRHMWSSVWISWNTGLTNNNYLGHG